MRADYRLVRRRVVNHLKQQLSGYQKQLLSINNGIKCYRFDETVLDRLHATLCSYLGHFGWANSHRLEQNLRERFSFLTVYFERDGMTSKLLRKYRAPNGFTRVRQQYFWFRWRFEQYIVLFEVGRFYEFYHLDDNKIAGFLGLKAMRKNRRGARYGFLTGCLHTYMTRLIQAGYAVCLVREDKTSGEHPCRRKVVFCYE